MKKTKDTVGDSSMAIIDKELINIFNNGYRQGYRNARETERLSKTSKECSFCGRKMTTHMYIEYEYNGGENGCGCGAGRWGMCSSCADRFTPIFIEGLERLRKERDCLLRARVESAAAEDD